MIEVADSSIEYDRTIKLPLYAENKINQIWLIDLNQSFLEVYQNPQKNYYQNMQKLGADNSVTLHEPEKFKIDLSFLL